jgi:hypothetical protein
MFDSGDQVVENDCIGAFRLGYIHDGGCTRAEGSEK